jgi:hypothetical protein
VKSEGPTFLKSWFGKSVESLQELVIRKQRQDRSEAPPGQAQRAEGGTSTTVARGSGGTRQVVEKCGAGLLQLPRGARESRQSQQFSAGGEQTLVACVTAPRSEPPDDLGAACTTHQALAPAPQASSSVSRYAQISAERAACRNAARADLCGGRWVTNVPTATFGRKCKTRASSKIV